MPSPVGTARERCVLVSNDPIPDHTSRGHGSSSPVAAVPLRGALRDQPSTSVRSPSSRRTAEYYDPPVEVSGTIGTRSSSPGAARGKCHAPDVRVHQPMHHTNRVNEPAAPRNGTTFFGSWLGRSPPCTEPAVYSHLT